MNSCADIYSISQDHLVEPSINFLKVLSFLEQNILLFLGKYPRKYCLLIQKYTHKKFQTPSLNIMCNSRKEQSLFPPYFQINTSCIQRSTWWCGSVSLMFWLLKLWINYQSMLTPCGCFGAVQKDFSENSSSSTFYWTVNIAYYWFHLD